MGFKWSPIEDLPRDHRTLENTELRALAKVWSEQRDDLTEEGLIGPFTERLCRQWAIETGILEQLYTLDRGITTLLVEEGLDAALIPSEATDRDPEEVALVLQDHRSALEGLFAFVRRGRDLSVSYVRELHAELTRHQRAVAAVDADGRTVHVPLQHGTFKFRSNNPRRPNGSIHEYCPPEHVDSEMDRLVELHLAHDGSGVAPEVESAWLHHRFTQIHPFQDGNGRVARALASLVMLRAGLFPVVIERDHRSRYLDALEAADEGRLESLVELVVKVQRRALVDALGLVREVTAETTDVKEVIRAARQDFENRRSFVDDQHAKAKTFADKLLDHSCARMASIAREIESEFDPLGHPMVRTDEARDGAENDHYFRYQIVETARRLGYFADMETYRAWSRLSIGRDPQHNLLVSFHGLGRPFRGMMAAQSAYFRRSRTSPREVETEAVIPLTEEVFQFNYNEDEADVIGRFEPWIERGLVNGLAQWRAAM